MPIPHEGFSGTPPRTPTLEEIIKIFGVAKNFEFTHDFETDDIRCSFKVSKDDCVREGLSVNLFASVFLAATKEHLGKLAFFEELVSKYSNPDVGGSTAADCISFLRNELKNLIFSNSLESTLKRSFFETIIEKLNELGQWRTFVDAARFERMRKEQERAEDIRAQAEYARRRHEEEMRKERDRQRKRESSFKDEWAEWGPYRSPFEDEKERKRYEDLFRKAQEEMFRHGPFGFRGGQDQYRQQQQQGPHQQYRQRTRNDRVRPKGNWWEILGVAPNSTKATIKSAWRKLAKQFHPDRAGGDPVKMAEINAAKDEGISGASS